MVKKAASILVMLGLAVGTAMYLSSCAKLAGPLSPDVKKYAPMENANNDMPTVEDADYPNNVSDTARVRFSMSLDPASVSTGTVLVYMQGADGTTETLYGNYAVTYLPQSKEIIVRPANGAWDDNQNYRAVFTTQIRSLAGGQPLDGNENGIADGPEFDNVGDGGDIGSPVSPGYTWMMKAVQVAGVSVNGAGTSFGGYAGNVDAAYSHVTITVQFETTGSEPADFAMDSSTFFQSATTLHPNVVFTDAAGNAVAPLDVQVLTTSYTDDTLQIVFNNLQPNTKYLFKLKGGLGGIRSSDAATIVLSRHFYFDGNDNNVAEASDDTKDLAIMTSNAEDQDQPIVRVSGSSYDSGTRRITLVFSVGAGIGTLDPATINTSYIQVLNVDDDLGITPAAITLNNSTAPAPEVYIDIPQKFSPSSGTNDYDVRVKVLRTVRSSDGTTMDQNSDGVLLTDDDEYLSGTFNITSYGFPDL